MKKTLKRNQNRGPFLLPLKPKYKKGKKIFLPDLIATSWVDQEENDWDCVSPRVDIL